MVRGMLERGRASTFKLEPRVEVLVRACRACGLEVPASDDYHYPLSPRTEQTVHYLVGAMPTNAELAKRVQGAILQYHGATGVMTEVEGHLLTRTLDAAHLDKLKHALFFLSRFGEQFRLDPILGPMFPPPQTVETVRTAAPDAASPLAPRPQPPRPPEAPRAVHMASRSSAVGADDPMVGKADRLLAYLGPKMDVVRLINARFDPSQMGRVSDVTAPSAKLARTLGATLHKDNKALMQTLHEAYALFVQLMRDQRSYQSRGFAEPTRQVYFRLRVHTMNFLKEPMLRELFPAGDKDRLTDV